MTASNARQLLAEIIKLKPRLNEWERSFLESVVKQMERYPNMRSISEKQGKALLNIYEKATGGGIYARRQYI